MRKIVATLLLVFLMPGVAIAQENRAAITAEINHKFPTNSQGLITASILRGFLDDFLASITAISGDVNVVANTVLAQMPATTVKANVTGSTANAADISLVNFFGAAPVNSIPADAVIGASLGPIEGFAPAGSYTQMAVTSTSSFAALPVGSTAIIIYNTGSVAAYVKLAQGGSPVVTTTASDVIQPGSWINFVVGMNTNLAAITATGSTSLTISEGQGLAAGSGGGSSSGGSGLSVTDGTAFSAGVSSFTPGGGTYNASPPTLASGQQGTFALSANRSVHVLDDNSATQTSTLTSILTGVNSSIPAGTNSIGTVGLNAGSAVVGTVNTVTTNNGNGVPHICGNHVFKHITTATDTQIVAASGSTTIYVCDYSFSFNGTGNAYLEKATSGTCGTLTQIDQTWYGAANVGKIASNPYYQGLNTGASAQLCVNTSQAVSFDISVNYDQY